MNKATSRSINIGDQKEGYRDDKRQHEAEFSRGFAIPRPKTEQHVRTECDGHHEPPHSDGKPVPERRLRVALRIDYVVHAGEYQRHNRRWLRGSWSANGIPEGGL